MKKIKITVLLYLIVLFGSCTDEEIIRSGNAPEGESALISVSLTGAQMGSGTKSRSLTEEEEKEINNIHVMVFDQGGAVVTSTHFNTYTDNLKVSTYSGSNRTICVFANGDAHTNIDNDLKKVTKLSDLDSIKVENGLHDLHRTKGLLMYGKTVTDIFPGNATKIPAIQLSHLSAKVTLKVIDNTPSPQSVQLIGWDVINVPVKGYLNERAKSEGETGSDDGVDVDTESDFFSTDGKYPFEKEDGKSATQVLYLFPNRRGGRVDRALPDDKDKIYTGMGVGDGDHRGKAWFAPPRATYILIYAVHRDGVASEQILAKIYIGEDNNSDYNITRGTHYNFTVTVNGLNEINVDSNVDHRPRSMNVDHGSSLTMDAHPDFRPFRIQAPKGKATIEILDQNSNPYNDRAFSATWLKVSPLNLIYHQVKQSGSNGNWQQDGAVGDFVRAKYIPHKTVRAALAGTGGWNNVPQGKEDDDLMNFDDAKYRMCYKITDIPFENVATSTFQTMCVYADEYISDMEGTRYAKVRVTYLKDGSNEGDEEVMIFDIAQRGPKTIFNMNDANAGFVRLNEDGTVSKGAKHKFVVEQSEEVDMVINPGIPLDVQSTNFMQWGFRYSFLYGGSDRFRNGNFVTAKSVYNDVKRSNNEPTDFGLQGSSLRPKYGNGLKNGDGVIPNYGNGSHSGTPYYYPTAANNIYHPIYKSSAARYCHEKNRDLNGDGYIDASEAKWYLPSQQELLMLWVANVDYMSYSNPYWSSTERGEQESFCVQMSTKSGGPTIRPKNTNNARVRCVRDITTP